MHEFKRISKSKSFEVIFLKPYLYLKQGFYELKLFQTFLDLKFYDT